MKLRRLTAAGVEEMRAFLHAVRRREVDSVPSSLLLGQEAGLEVAGSPKIEHQVFGSRFRFAQWVYELIETIGQSGLDRDEGLWSWLTLFFFDEVFARNKAGVRVVRAEWRYIPRFDNYRMFYRHLLAGPYTLYRAHSDDPTRAMALLVQPLGVPGELVEQIASRRELATSRAVVGAATKLYLKPGKGALKLGAGGSGAGSPRRLALVLDQFDCTYDLHSVDADRLVSMLPAEFDRFKVSPAAGA